MPIYEFRCKECGHRFDKLCRMDESGEGIPCPSCGHVGATKLMSVFMATGLENGHHGIGKTWGSGGGRAGSKDSSNGSSDGSSDTSPSDSSGASSSGTSGAETSKAPAAD